jgi:hypothetical protein
MKCKLCMTLCAFVPTVQQAQASADGYACSQLVVRSTLDVPCVPSDSEMFGIQKRVAENAYSFLRDTRCRDNIAIYVGSRGCERLNGTSGGCSSIASEMRSSLRDRPAESLQMGKVDYVPFRSGLENRWHSDVGAFTFDGNVMYVQLMGLAHENIIRSVAASDKEGLVCIFDALYDHDAAERQLLRPV